MRSIEIRQALLTYIHEIVSCLEIVKEYDGKPYTYKAQIGIGLTRIPHDSRYGNPGEWKKDPILIGNSRRWCSIAGLYEFKRRAVVFQFLAGLAMEGHLYCSYYEDTLPIVNGCIRDPRGYDTQSIKVAKAYWTYEVTDPKSCPQLNEFVTGCIKDMAYSYKTISRSDRLFGL